MGKATNGLYSTVAFRAVRIVYTASNGQEFPVTFQPGERITSTVTVQLTDGSIRSAVATGEGVAA